MNLFKKTALFLTLFLVENLYSQSSEFDGFVLYNKQNQNIAYLIDKDGNIAHTWNCDLACNYTVLLKNNGNIVRGTINPGNQLGGAAEGGMVQEIDPNGNVVWEFIYSDATHLSHHDITLVNDNVLLTAWEVKTPSELTQAGYEGATSDKWPTHFIEVAHDGSGGGEIVWEWHIWDHLIQDYDPSKDNYGSIAEHPELIDVNMIEVAGGGPGGGGPGGGPGGAGGDWFHVNGVDYNAELDQIAFSSRHTSEIYIIDHSTTTEEAAGHTGGNSGMGGDIMYRWGNPSNYGAPGAQQIPSAVHDVRWITNDGRTNGGFLQFYNNSGAGNISTVDAIETPWNGFSYDLVDGQSFSPSSNTWRHICEGFSPGQSSQDLMSNGNVFVNMSGGQGGAGYMYEADSLGTVIWQYNAGGTQKAFRYECKHPGIIALLGNPCGDQNNTNIQENNFNQVVISPNPTNSTFEINGLDNIDYEFEVINALGEPIQPRYNGGIIDLSNFPNGLYFVRISSSEGSYATKSVSLVK